MLELQSCNASSPAQRFAVDGDAILMGSQASGKVTREFVIERQNGSTVAQTPLVVATRTLAESGTLRIDARYFRFNAADGSGAAPTSGFMTVADETHLVCAAQCGWGTVVEIDERQPLGLSQLSRRDQLIDGADIAYAIPVTDGTTIRGYRSYTYNGPEVLTCALTDWAVFLATGRAVRFTGFRLRGPYGDSTCGQAKQTDTGQTAIAVVHSPFWSLSLPNVWIDHMEISHWGGAATGMGAPDYGGDPLGQPTPCTECSYPDTPIALVVGSFLHEDVYETVPSSGQFAQIRANVFYGAVNQPVTSREMSCLGGYAATDNLLLSETGSGSSDDVDMHGSKPPGSWSSGLAGDYFDVGWNTFLKTDTTVPITGGVVGPFIANVNERGTSCRFIQIHDNVFLQIEGNAIRVPPSFNHPVEYGNTFGAGDPTQGLLLVGDFDGDKVDDVFLATGAAWYYSSGGQAEWRFLNRASEPASALLLGDFDGDGRTDVLTLHGSNIDVSWAGVSGWQTINTTASPLADLAVGDFDGDGRSDLLLATGRQWLFASGGRNWVPFAAYTDTIPNLRFGHFTDKTKTQILAVHDGHWEVMEWGNSSWTRLGVAPVDSVEGLVAGDFDGQGYTELARSNLISATGASPVFEWEYTSPGHGSSWSSLGASSSPIQILPIGNFQGGNQDGVITWAKNHFYYTHSTGAGTNTELLSRQVMR
jgi:hypothetical protein